MNKEFHIGNRQRLYTMLQPGSLMVLFSGDELVSLQTLTICSMPTGTLSTSPVFLRSSPSCWPRKTGTEAFPNACICCPRMLWQSAGPDVG